MKTNGNLWIKLLAVVLLLATLLPCFATTVVAVASETSQKDEVATEVVEVPLPEEGEDEPETDPTPVIEHVGEGDEEDEREPERIPIEDPTGREETMVGGVITTEDGYRIRLNKDEKSYTVVGYIGVSEDVEIPASYQGYPITRIGDSAFNGNLTMVNVTIPESVTFVGERAFYNCAKLTYNEVDGGLYLGTASNPYYYFVGPKSKDVTEFCVYSEAEIVGAFAFERCAALKTVEMGTNVKSVGFGALMQCNAIESVTLPFFGENGNRESDAHLGYVFGARTVGGNISYVPLSLRHLHVMGGTYVRANALYGIDMLESLTLPFLGSSATDTENNYFSYIFGGASYQDNVVPQSLTSVTVLGGEIGYGAFYECVHLTEAVIGEGIKTIGERAFYGCVELASVTISSSVMTIGEYAFYNCSGLTSVTIPSSVTTIGGGAFYNCGRLMSIAIPNGVTSIGSYAFYNCNSLTAVYITDLLAWCNVDFLNGNTSWLGVYEANPLYYAHNLYLNGNLVTHLEIPNGATNIKENVFCGCTSITSVTIPASVTSIGSLAFYNCNNLEGVYITDLAAWCNIYFDLDNPLCYAENLYLNGNLITELDLPNDVTAIGAYAFYGYANLTSITIPDNIISIGERAFYNCTGVSEINFNAVAMEDLSSGNCVFAYAGQSSKGITVNVGSNVTRIPKRLFWADNLKIISVIFAEDSACESIGFAAFSGCSDLTNVIIPASVTSIEGYAFSGCTDLTSVTIPESVISIEEGAFDGCTGLSEINFNAVAMEDLSSRNYVFTYAGQSGNGITINIGADVIKVPANLFCPVYPDNNSYTPKITAVTFTERGKCESIGSYAFAGCNSLTAVYITDLAAWCKIEFSGTGANPLYYAKNLYLNGSLVTELEIPSGVTSVNSCAFTNCESITSITMPESITSIGSSAFGGCSNLAKIIIPDSVVSIGNYAFSRCSSLTNIAIPSGVTSISDYMFYNCNALTSVMMHDNITSIGKYSFYNCSSLMAITIPKNVVSVGEYAFYKCIALTEINFNVTAMEDLSDYNYVFAYAGQNGAGITVNIGANVTKIPAYLFKSGYSESEPKIIEIVFAEKSACESIGSWAFCGCDITSIEIPESITFVGKSAFAGCNSLTAVYITDLAAWCSIDFVDSTANPLYYAKTLYLDGSEIAGDILIPDTLTSISMYAFYSCDQITSVVIPDSVTSIGSYAFADCNSLTSVYTTDLATWCNIEFAGNYANPLMNGGQLYLNGNEIAGDIVIPNTVTSIPACTFSRCDQITSITIPDSVTSIGMYAFHYCNSLTSITIPTSVAYIPQSAFQSCSSLTSVTIPSSVTSVATNAFAFCNNLEVVYYLGTEEDWSKVTVGSGNNNLSNVLVFQNGVATIVDSNADSASPVIFESAEVLTYNSSPAQGVYEVQPVASEGLIFKSYGDGTCAVTGIGNCTDTILVIPSVSPDGDVVTSIASEAFYRCSSLETIVIPESVTYIGEQAFSQCSGLVSITIPENVLWISEYAFSGCAALEIINFNASEAISEAMASAFGNAGTNSSGIVVNIGANVTRIPRWLFGGANVIAVNFEDGSQCVEIGKRAFSGCSNLTSFTIPESVTSIDNYAFYNCSGLSAVHIIDMDVWYNIKFGGDSANPLYYAKNLYLNGTLVTDLEIPSNVAELNEYAFVNCINLKSVTFAEGSKLAALHSNIFNGCTALETITYPGEYNEWRHIRKATDWNSGAGACKVVYAENSGLLYDSNEELTEFWASGYAGVGGAVKIPAYYSGRTVTMIYDEAFSDHDEITSIDMDDTVLYIGEGAFQNCVNLKRIRISNNLTYMLRGILEGCSSLEMLNLPFLGTTDRNEEEDYLGYVFGAATAEENGIYVPQALRSVTVLRGDAEGAVINANAFWGCGYLEQIVIPEGTVSIGNEAFADCISLRTFVIPDSVTYVGVEIFENCNALTEITIGAGLTELTDHADVTDENGNVIANVGNPLFGLDKSRSQLRRYVVAEGNPVFGVDAHGILYRVMEIPNNTGAELVKVAVVDVPARADLGGFVMPDHIVSIEPYAFAYNTTLRAISMQYVRHIGNNAFYCASALVNVTLNDPAADKVDGEYEDAVDQLAYNQYIGDRAFMGCTSLMKIDIDSRHIVGFGDYAVADCPKLITVMMGAKVQKLGLSAFGATASGDSNLERFVVDAANPYFKSIDGVLYSINSDGSLTLEIFPAAHMIYAADGEPLYENGQKVYATEFVLPTGQNITAVQSYAFQTAKYLTVLMLNPENEMIVGDYAFANSRLQHVTLGKNVVSLGLLRGEGEYTVFADMEYLTAIEVDAENGYYSSDEGVLFDKDQRTLIKYPASKTGKLYTLPETVQIIASMAFKRNGNLIYVTVPSHVSVVGLEAFYACGQLQMVYFEDVYAPVSVMENAFTTKLGIEDGVAESVTAQIGYSAAYYANGENGEYGWENYASVYDLAVCENPPVLMTEVKDEFYAVVVLDDNGNRLPGLHVTLTDPNGLSETVATGAGAEGTGVAMFYGLFNTEGVGFALDFENPYALKIGDPTSVYSEFINPCFYLDEDMRITYVTLSKKPFDVSFHLSGGKGSMPVLSLVVGETVDIPNANVSRDGYKLLGWSSMLNGAMEFESTFCANSYRAHTVLYAVWEANENTIHFDGNFGYRENGTGSTVDLVVRTDHTEALPQSGFSVQGYVFAGWATAPDGSAVYADQGAYTADARSEVTLYAVWAPDKGTLKFNANGGTGTMSDVTILTEERISLPQNTFTRKGYTFAGWTENGVSYADGAAYTANAESTHVLYAVWTPNTNAVRFNANGGKGSMTNAYGKTDSTITLPKTTFTRSNYVQIGWSLTAGGALMYTNGGEYTVTAESETTLYAVWVEVPKAYGVSCGESDINSQTAQLNKAGYDYPNTKLYNQSLGYVEGNVYSDGMVYETERIAVIAYCDPYLSFFDKDGKLVDNSIGLYQNGVKVAGVAEYAVQGDSVIFYFEPYVNELACEVDIEAWIVAEDTTGTKAISHTVLNIHVFDFIITGDDVDLDTDEVSVDLSAGGEILKKLFGKDDLSFNISKNTKFTVDIQGDTVTLQLKGSKSKSKSYSSYKDGYLAESKANNKNTWYFTYTGEYKDSKDKKHKLKYNVRFARDHQAENYYYYQCIVYEDGKEVERFYGGVNGLNVKSILGMSNSKKSSRTDVAVKARLIYEMHFRAVKNAKKVKVGYDAIYAETLKKEPNQTESSTKFSVELSGDLVFKYDVKKGFVPVSSTIKGTISVNFTHNQQFIVWIIPIVLEIDVDAKGGLAIKMNFDNGRNITMDEAKLTLNVDFGISAGVGCKAISGGVYGGAGTVFVIEFYPDFGVDSWKVNANFGVYIRVALWTKKWEIWSGNHYIIGGPSTSSASASTMRLEAAYLIDNYEPARGDDLESGAQLFMLGDTLYKLSFMDVSALEGYDAYNYAKLTLSKWSGSYWEDPVILDEQSKTNDVAFTVYGEDGRVFVALTQQTERMTAELGNDPYAAADNLAVKLVEIFADGYTVSCVNQKRDHYVYLPQYACVDGVPTMVWVENADNNMFGVSPYNYYSEDSDEYHTFATSANSVWMCRQVDGAWSEPVLIASGLSSVTDLALTDNGRIAYIVDADGDLADPGDRVLYYGGANGGFAVAEDPEAGCVTNLVADAETLMYYFDAQEDVEDGWRQLSAPINTLPEGLPADFVAVYNANGVLDAVLYHSTKYWTDESGERVSGSAIYGMFLENGVWGKAVELDSYEPVANLYVTDLDAEYIAANGILLYVELIESESERTDHVTYIQQKQATLTVSGLAVDYAGKKVTFTVSNTGACGTAVYMSVNGEDNYMLLDEMLLSGHSATYTVALTGSEKLIYTVRIAETQQGSGCISTEKIDLNYSDLRPFVKQLLIGGKDVLLLAVKNTGNMANTGITVIRLGQYAANAILTDEMVAQISELTLQPGVPTLVSITNENGEEELLWVVEDTVEAGNIVYHEIALSEHQALSSQNTLSVVTLPRNASVEKGGASANNTAYLTYSNLIGVLAEGETVTVLPELLESEIALDKTASADIELNYTAGESAAVTDIAIGNESLGAEQYSVSAALVSGRITIKSEALKDLAAGTYVLTVTFADGTACEVTLRVLKTYTVTWQNGTDVISAILVSEGILPTAPGVPARPADKAYVYTFAGWSTVPNGAPESISAADGDVTYYAVWRTDLREYTVTWVMKDSNGDTVKVEESYAHGSIPAYEGTVFVPDEMRFAGWNVEILPVSGDVIYTAVYKQNLLMGDVNGDGFVNTRDLALLRQYVVGLAELTDGQLEHCNVYEDYYDDGSAKINTRDIALLQQYIVGVVDTLE